MADPTTPTVDLMLRLRGRGRWVTTKRVPLIPQMNEESWVADELCAEAADEIERLREIVASVPSLAEWDAHQAFHRLTVKERDFERRKVDRLVAEVNQLHTALVECDSLLSLARYRGTDEEWRREVDRLISKVRTMTAATNGPDARLGDSPKNGSSSHPVSGEPGPTSGEPTA